MKYRKKPVVVEAIRWTGCMRSFEEIKQFCPDIVDGGAVWHPYAPPTEPSTSSWPLFIQTLEGNMAAQIGDYIIKGVNGEFYLCKPDIFEKTYEKAGMKADEESGMYEEPNIPHPHHNAPVVATFKLDRLGNTAGPVIEGESQRRCNLSDDDLIKRCGDWISKLCKTRGGAWCLRVPVDFDHDPDMLFIELIQRYKETRKNGKD
jgi:hypothetical protein